MNSHPVAISADHRGGLQHDRSNDSTSHHNPMHMNEPCTGKTSLIGYADLSDSLSEVIFTAWC